MEPVTVDIVVIGRNEGPLLEKALQSSLAAAIEFSGLGIPRPHILYVDGQSTDNSLIIARQLGIMCYGVTGKPNPAKGRHEGFSHCDGKYTFFIDGDMEIYPGWLTTGIKYLENHPDIAGTAGFCDWEVYEGNSFRRIPNYTNIKRNGQNVTGDVGGAFIYRAEVLRLIGDFDPTMVRVGELELYYRIVAAGYKLVYLYSPMVIHRDMKGSMGLNFLVRSLFTRNIFINGVIASKSVKNKAVIAMMFHRYWIFLWQVISMAWIVVAICLYLTTFHNNFWLISAVLGIIQLFIVHFYYKGLNFNRALVSILVTNVYCLAFLFGYLFRWPEVGGYFTKSRGRAMENG